jgi:hypothetical protein
VNVSGLTDERLIRREFYGIAEIADALGLARGLVTVWRKRRSHGMPEPDAELASGPVWRGQTVEPWIESVRDRATVDSPPPVGQDLALRVARRMLRVVVLLLEEPPRTGHLARALYEARELVPPVEGCLADELGRALRELLAPLDSAEIDPGSADGIRTLRAAAPAILATAARAVELLGISAKADAGWSNAR